MSAAFGTGDARPRQWSDYRFLENHPVIRAGGLRGTEVTITFNGQTQIVQLEQEWTFGRKQQQRPWFRCPDCNRRCRLLHEKDGAFVCRLCSGYDYRSRHRNRSCPALNRVRRGLPACPIEPSRARGSLLRSRLLGCYVLQSPTSNAEPGEASDD